jgi:hypothetical protein
MRVTLNLTPGLVLALALLPQSVAAGAGIPTELIKEGAARLGFSSVDHFRAFGSGVFGAVVRDVAPGLITGALVATAVDLVDTDNDTLAGFERVVAGLLMMHRIDRVSCARMGGVLDLDADAGIVEGAGGLAGLYAMFAANVVTGGLQVPYESTSALLGKDEDEADTFLASIGDKLKSFVK